MGEQKRGEDSREGRIEGLKLYVGKEPDAMAKWAKFKRANDIFVSFSLLPCSPPLLFPALPFPPLPSPPLPSPPTLFLSLLLIIDMDILSNMRGGGNIVDWLVRPRNKTWHFQRYESRGVQKRREKRMRKERECVCVCGRKRERGKRGGKRVTAFTTFS